MARRTTSTSKRKSQHAKSVKAKVGARMKHGRSLISRLKFW
ncbi:MAG TPA: hypothetical protein VKQ05_06210 [Gemmatimonadales bacterium]|nr:hypothetical protein [Gemmatimonadales bacterium]